MPEITVDIDEGLLLAAERHAARAGQTLGGIILDLLARETGWTGAEGGCPPDAGAALPTLRSYSEGRMSRRDAMHALGLPPERQSDFVEAMNSLGIAWPTPDPMRIAREAEIVAEAIREALRTDQSPEFGPVRANARES